MIHCWLSLNNLGYGIPFDALNDEEAKAIARRHLRHHRVRTRFALQSRPDNEPEVVYTWTIIDDVKER